jgi:2'-5' RNA ligase
MTSESTLRAFVALDVGDAARSRIEQAQHSLLTSGAVLKLVRPCDVHLTLLFLGEVDAGRVPALSDAVRVSAAGICPFTLSLTGVGSFGPRDTPRVVWVGVHGDLEPMKTLHSRLVLEVAAMDLLPEERAFSPHLTLARVKSPRNTGRLIHTLGQMRDMAFGDVRIESVRLIRSRLQASGPEYTILCEAPLGGDGGRH